MKGDIETILQMQAEAERNLSPEQRERARDILRPVPPAFAVLVYAQECGMRAEMVQAPDSPMGEYCQLMLLLRPEERRLVAQNSVPEDVEKMSIIHRAIGLRTRLLSYKKPRRGYPWMESAG